MAKKKEGRGGANHADVHQGGKELDRSGWGAQEDRIIGGRFLIHIVGRSVGGWEAESGDVS